MDLSQEALEALAAEVGHVLSARGLMLATAESCTGGWVAQAVTAIAGSSAWFDRGFVTYSNSAKRDMLGVSAETLERHGAVSEATVAEMAHGALRHSQAQVACAISGIAGPTGGSDSKPVGTVCFAWSWVGGETRCETRHLPGDRREVRARALRHALEGVLSGLAAMP
jgi:nicotinamide-nucleotide amidase